MKEPDLQVGERVEWATRANRSQGNRAVGGRLFLTNERLVFAPHRFDDVLGGESWSRRRQDVEDVAVEPSGVHPFSGALRPRLRIVFLDAVELFVVPRVADVVQRLKAALLAQET